jgi:hypothetical protein
MSGVISLPGLLATLLIDILCTPHLTEALSCDVFISSSLARAFIKSAALASSARAVAFF